MHQCLKFILFGVTLHVSDSLSVHHQEFKTVHNSNRHTSYRYCYCLLTSSSSICMTYACCCMDSVELLMMDGKTVRNMWRVSPNKINLRSSWFYHRNAFCFSSHTTRPWLLAAAVWQVFIKSATYTCRPLFLAFTSRRWRSGAAKRLTLPTNFASDTLR